MKTSPRMQAIITQIAEKHGFDLTTAGTYLRLTMAHFDPLVIQVVGKNLVSVDHFYQPYPHLEVADPGILFFTGYAEWVPIEVMQRLGGHRVYAHLTEDYEAIADLLPAPQADLADFAEMWAQNIEAQGWLDVAPSSPTGRRGEEASSASG